MTPEQQAGVWRQLDRKHLAQIAFEGPPPVFATVSGAHLYGFASADSDVDLRGAFLLPTQELLGLRPPSETVSIADDSVIDLDWVAHDLRKFARLMTNHNGYVLEQLYSPLVVVETAAFEELRAIGRGCVTRPTARHYRGFGRGRRERLQEPNPTVKHLLYAYRVLLTGIHLMQSGEVVAYLPELNDHFQIAGLDELIVRKKEGSESMPLDASEVSEHLVVLECLDEQLASAQSASRLPDEAVTVAALEDFVIRLRLSGLSGDNIE